MRAPLFFVLSVVALVVAWTIVAAIGPDTLPLELSLSGDVGDWQPREEALVVLAGLGGAFVFCCLAVVAVYPRLPSWMISVHTPYLSYWTATPERERVLRKKLKAESWVVGGFMLWCLAVWMGLLGWAGSMRDPDLGPIITILAVCLGVLVAGFAAWSHLANYRPEDE